MLLPATASATTAAADVDRNCYYCCCCGVATHILRQVRQVTLPKCKLGDPYDGTAAAAAAATASATTTTTAAAADVAVGISE